MDGETFYSLAEVRIVIESWPTSVVLGGKVMVQGGALVGRKGDGRYRARALPAL